MGLIDATENFEELLARLRGKRVVIFLDYDGTLAEIVSEPDKAFMAEEMRTVVRELAAKFPVAIVSGRARAKVHAFVQLDELCSHGFDISGPARWPLAHRVAEQFLPKLESVRDELGVALATVPGAAVEDNRFSVTVHFRNVAAEQVGEVEAAVDAALARVGPEITSRRGKMVIELRPAVEWHKGKAVRWLLAALGLDARPDVVPVYLGDDITDEDAFEHLRAREGPPPVTVLVADDPAARPSHAEFWVRSPTQVRALLHRIAEEGPRCAAPALAMHPAGGSRATTAAADGEEGVAPGQGGK